MKSEKEQSPAYRWNFCQANHWEIVLSSPKCIIISQDKKWSPRKCTEHGVPSAPLHSIFLSGSSTGGQPFLTPSSSSPFSGFLENLAVATIGCVVPWRSECYRKPGPDGWLTSERAGYGCNPAVTFRNRGICVHEEARAAACSHLTFSPGLSWAI